MLFGFVFQLFTGCLSSARFKVQASCERCLILERRRGVAWLVFMAFAEIYMQPRANDIYANFNEAARGQITN